MFQPIISDEIEKIFKKDKNKELILITKQKIKEICLQDYETINHYKNLRNNLSDFKRVHIMKSFVLTFKVDYNENIIYFMRLEHHDNIY